MPQKKLIALVDLGDTLAECTQAINSGLAHLGKPSEFKEDGCIITPPFHLESRRHAMLSAPGFWSNLSPREEGFTLIRLLRNANFKIHILTKGPYDAPQVWADKVAWCRLYLPDVPVIITDDKARVHGHLLIDDWIPYVNQWLSEWPEGRAIIPSQPWNQQVCLGPRCVRDDETNRKSLIELLRDTSWAR